MAIKKILDKALNEKDVENTYRSEFLKMEGASITSPYAVDGLLEVKEKTKTDKEKITVRSLLEFKYQETFKSKLTQCSVLIQCLYYLKKFETDGQKLPTTIFVGDNNECFALHTNSIVKYLSSEVDWKIAPSEAAKRNPTLLQAMVNDINILPFIYDIDNHFQIKDVFEKIKEFSDNVVRKIRVTQHNIVTIFDYFDKNVLGSKVALSTNEKANLFIQILINPNENYIHPKNKTKLTTKSFGEITINQNLFNSFFQHFEGDVYSPREKESLTAFIDRLVEDSTRRQKGEFFTPTPFVDLAHKYIADTFGSDWKEKYVVWDSAWGTGNLTRDYKFTELYCSTLEQSDIDTANQMGYNNEATKFQYDFLNDGDAKLPLGIKEAILKGKEILFLINPPYGEAKGDSKEGKIGAKSSETSMGNFMNSVKLGYSTRQLYTQFLYRITEYQKINKNIKVCIFSNGLYKTSVNFKPFREYFFNHFDFRSGMLFEASHFSDVSKGWGIDFTIWGNSKNDSDTFPMDIIEINEDYDLVKINQIEQYNTDYNISSSDWIRSKLSKVKLIPTIQVKTALIPAQSNVNNIAPNSLGYLLIKANKVKSNTQEVGLYCTATSNRGGVSLKEENIIDGIALFSARKLISSNWINVNDEYLAPNEQHPQYEQFTYDSLIYSLFNSHSQQGSLRQVDFNDKKWDVKNEFFWLSKKEMLDLGENNHYDELYKDAKNGEERYIHIKLYKEGIYEKLSPDAKIVLDQATELVKQSITMRQMISEQNPDYHLDSFDCGYAQLKIVWKDYFKDEFKAFRDAYKEFEDRLRPMVYELGFLKK